MEKRYPLGVVIAALLMFIFSAFGFYVIWFVSMWSGKGPAGYIDTAQIFYTIFWGVPGLLFFLGGINLLRLKDWARKIVVILSAIIVIIEGIFGLLALLSLRGNDESGGIFWYLYFILPPAFPALFFLIYFTRPKVKECFKNSEVNMNKDKLPFVILAIVIALACVFIFLQQQGKVHGNREKKGIKEQVTQKIKEPEARRTIAGVKKQEKRETPSLKGRPGVVFCDDFEDGDFTRDPAWHCESQSPHAVIGKEGDEQYASVAWEVERGVLCFTGNFSNLNLGSNEIFVPANTQRLVIEYDTSLGGTWAHYNLIRLSDAQGNTVLTGGVYCDGYNYSGRRHNTNNGLYFVMGGTTTYMEQLPDNSILPNTWKHVKIIFDRGSVSVDYDNGAFTSVRRAPYSTLPEIRKIELCGWQHTGGSQFDNIVVSLESSI